MAAIQWSPSNLDPWNENTSILFAVPNMFFTPHNLQDTSLIKVISSVPRVFISERFHWILYTVYMYMTNHSKRMLRIKRQGNTTERQSNTTQHMPKAVIFQRKLADSGEFKPMILGNILKTSARYLKGCVVLQCQFEKGKEHFHVFREFYTQHYRIGGITVYSHHMTIMSLHLTIIRPHLLLALPQSWWHPPTPQCLRRLHLPGTWVAEPPSQTVRWSAHLHGWACGPNSEVWHRSMTQDQQPAVYFLQWLVLAKEIQWTEIPPQQLQLDKIVVTPLPPAKFSLMATVQIH